MAALNVVRLDDYRQDWSPYVKGRVMGVYSVLGEDFVKIASRHECRVLARIFREHIPEANTKKYALALWAQRLERMARDPERRPFYLYELQAPAFE